MITRLSSFAAAAAMLAACASAPSAPAVPDAPDAAIPSSANDTCGASMYAELIGKPIDGQGVPGESRLNRRILPGTQVTMDYIAQRMNMEADAAGMIRKINCG
jgi:hypothetical protein